MFDFLFSSVQPDTVSLDAGPDFYNCGSCPHNCVGGSESGCPASALAPPPKPSSWYSVTDTSVLASNSHTQSLDAGPDFYNCGSCPHNCVGGSETSCPASAPAPPPKPSSWYSVTETSTLASNAHTQSLDAGPEFYNCMTCSHNCVGGSENGCIPGPAEAKIIVHDPSKMQLAAPLAAPAATGAEQVKTVRPGIGHVYNLGPAMILGAFAATAEAGGRLLSGRATPDDGWMAHFRSETDAAAGAVTPLGQLILRRHVFAGGEEEGQ